MKRLFSDDYFSARRRLLQACSQAKLAVESYCHPSIVDTRGEIALDVVRVGHKGAENVIFVSSGVHGTEGTVGSAVQLGILEQLSTAQMSNNTAVVIVHAVNPVGYANLTRGNEDNIDLNRNFKDFTQPLMANLDYVALHDALCSEFIHGEQRHADDLKIQQYIEQHGLSALLEKVLQGQHSIKEGLFYGGISPAWSRLVLEEIVQKYAGRARKVAIIDIHTGVGPKGVGLILRDQIRDVEQGNLAPIAGQVCSVIDQLGTAEQRIKLVLEFGTLAFDHVLKALRDDNWLGRQSSVPDDVRKQIKTQLFNALRIDEDEWYDAVWQQSWQLLQDVNNELNDTELSVRKNERVQN